MEKIAEAVGLEEVEWKGGWGKSGWRTPLRGPPCTTIGESGGIRRRGSRAEAEETREPASRREIMRTSGAQGPRKQGLEIDPWTYHVRADGNLSESHLEGSRGGRIS